MDRRNFLKAVPAIAAGLSIAPVAAAKYLTTERPLKSSIMLTWSYPGKGHGVATWNTPTEEEFDKALWECLLMHCRLACGGYDVEYREFNVLRFISANAESSDRE